MPAFSFEKISSPVRRVADTPAEKKQRGVIVQLLDRLVERRGKRSQKSDQTAAAESEPK